MSWGRVSWGTWSDAKSLVIENCGMVDSLKGKQCHRRTIGSSPAIQRLSANLAAFACNALRCRRNKRRKRTRLSWRSRAIGRFIAFLVPGRMASHFIASSPIENAKYFHCRQDHFPNRDRHLQRIETAPRDRALANASYASLTDVGTTWVSSEPTRNSMGVLWSVLSESATCGGIQPQWHTAAAMRLAPHGDDEVAHRSASR